MCTKPEYAPIRYHWFALTPGRSFAAELRDMLTEAGLAGGDRDRVFGEVAARMRALTRGQLAPIRHVKGPMDTVKGIDVFEVRVRTDRGDLDDVLVRVYHVEPSRLAHLGGSTVVGLHAHVKDVSDAALVMTRQDAELQVARDRYFEGRDTAWGGAVHL